MRDKYLLSEFYKITVITVALDFTIRYSIFSFCIHGIIHIYS
ncbi:hypothetical protein BA1379B_010090 [Bartonella sp. A1379B]|nr:hypothetical protein BA1379B_010090 [Bartonella sp. A1379B]